MTSTAEQHKLQGNVFFGQHLYQDAIREYGIAIIKDPTKPAYYTNRALCYLRLEQYDRAALDAEKALELDHDSVKGYYLLGQALSSPTETNLDPALHALQKAHSLSLNHQTPYSEEILNALRQTKKRRWEIFDASRRERDSDLYSFLRGLIETERERRIGETRSNGTRLNSNTWTDIAREFDNRLSELTSLFTRAEDHGGKREIPDYLQGKISLSLMTDPVQTPSGITYDRSEILSHLRKIGQWDPLSRAPLREQDLVPNLSLKECLEEFVSENGWAVDY